MKKTVKILLLGTMILSLAGCGKSTDTAAKDTAKTTDASDTSETSDKETTSITGIVETFTGSKLTLTTDDKKELVFDLSGAALECKNGMVAGNDITVVYTGSISGTDTSNVKVTKIVNTNDNPNSDDQLVTLQPKEITSDDQIPGKTDKDKEKAEKDAEDTEKKETPKVDTAITDVSETAYAVSAVNVRDAAVKNANVLGFINGGEAIQRTGICANGWSRVSYKGAEGYVWGEYLTTQAPSETPNADSAAAPVTASTSGTIVDASANTLTIAADDNSQTVFTISGASITCAEGLIIGNQVDVTYDSSQQGTGQPLPAITVSDTN